MHAKMKLILISEKQPLRWYTIDRAYKAGRVVRKDNRKKFLLSNFVPTVKHPSFSCSTSFTTQTVRHLA